jgi:hypothetical protein
LSKPSIFPIKNCKNEDGGNFNISTDILSVGYAESQDSKSLFDDSCLKTTFKVLFQSFKDCSHCFTYNALSLYIVP